MRAQEAIACEIARNDEKYAAYDNRENITGPYE